MLLALVAAGSLAAALGVVAAYAWWLMRGRPSPGSARLRPEDVLIVVPVFDEAPLIERKLENLAALTIPRRVVIVDGGSTDGSIDIVRDWISGRELFTLLETTHRNKTAQLNDALRLNPAEEWILVTDADALLEADTLERMLDVAAGDARVAVVGSHVRPAAAHALESLHWSATDWLRARESDRGSAGIVAAPCYLAHRDVLAHMPEDTLADDVHVTCRAMLAGRRIGHAGDAAVVELRSPRTLRALVRHKYRKADAYLREIVRFLPQVKIMPRPMRTIFLWRAALLTLVPLLGVIGGTAAIALIATSVQSIVVAALTAMLLFVIPPARGFALAALLAAVSAAALLTHPFSRQQASFPKILRASEY
ncbi:MAG TPA: glycosyltransferase [Thermoanaerobaculia bacterium]|jgi:cellulose synthase/poly-beta-1,6-N-acetylglucosamine synthase-like glycosyltransferase|nr:glycosyltransferase [Thermoanaerobaculia bacterium]